MPRTRRTKTAKTAKAQRPATSGDPSSPDSPSSPEPAGTVAADDIRHSPDDAGGTASVRDPGGAGSADLALLDEEEAPQESASARGTGAGRGGAHGTAAHGTARGYNQLKSFNGQVYSGMAVGGSHAWNYDPGVWEETKEEPDLWKIDFKTNKRRARKAPKGSGAPRGTEYHWLIVAHQHVKKLDANTYETHLAGSKYKLAHKGASANAWSVPTVKGQREREMELLEDAKRRIQGLPPVLAGEKVRVEKQERGQLRLDSMFAKGGGGPGSDAEDAAGTRKRRRVDDETSSD